jgi:class 3 adenylate cyclase
MAVDRRFHSLEDFLASTMTDVDGVLNDGGGVVFPVKGREIEATVLFSDISGFSTRTLGLSPVATLIYVQNFFAWITAKALDGRPGIVDKYIGDQLMVVFSAEFGSDDPFDDAVQAAAAMSRHDVLAYRPRMGIASGPVIVGYAGTAFRYNVSVFGGPVGLAARCAAVRPADPTAEVYSSIVMPAAEWGDRELDDLIAPVGSEVELRRFELLDGREVDMKGLGEVTVREIHDTGASLPTQSAEDRASAGLEYLRENGRYWPRARARKSS